MRLIDGDRDRIDGAAGDGFGSTRATGGQSGAACDDRQRGTSGDIYHHACSFCLPETLSSAFNTASLISVVESFFATGSAMSAVGAPFARAAATAFSSKSAASGRVSAIRSITATPTI